MNKNFLFPAIILFGMLCFSGTNRPIHLFLAGDSTMANKLIYKSAMDSLTGMMVTEKVKEHGWGQMLPMFFGKDVVVENHAQNGRSSRSFIAEGLWDSLVRKVAPNDYVVIQFGHNDSSVSKGERYSTPTQYEENLVRMVRDVKKKGGIPILCTSVVRRKFDENGILVNTHGEYPDIVRKISREEKIILIDLEKTTADWLQKEGKERSKHFFNQYPSGQSKLYPRGLYDNTHFNEKGAQTVAEMFVQELERQDIRPLIDQLRTYVNRYESKVWTPDLKNGYYKNPVLYADYSDPDVCFANGKYYMTASSFNCTPGLPILESSDLVNWSLVNHALPKIEPKEFFSKAQLGNGVWAPAIRFQDGWFYIYYGDPDHGIYMLKTENPCGKWSDPVLVKSGKGYIDPCPFWDEDGQAYLVHAYAGSRYGHKSLLVLCRMLPDGSSVIGDEQIIFDGHEKHTTCEGPKMYKYQGLYYVFFPAGGVATGWQTVARSNSPFGPYEVKTVMAQGSSAINGPHQGGWVRTKTNEDWFLHFQDVGAVGRVVHLQPMKWIDGWPVIGVDLDGDGCGEPVLTYKKPNVGDIKARLANPAETDEFNGDALGLQWQWYGNPKPTWCYVNEEEGYLRLFSDNPPIGYRNLLDMTNLLLQKFPAPNFVATAKMKFSPNKESKGESCGLAVVGLDYAHLSMEKIDGSKYRLSLLMCEEADQGKPELVQASVTVDVNAIFMRVTVKDGHVCSFSYSIDGKEYVSLGSPFMAREGKWIGAKVGLYCRRAEFKNDGGWVDVDWFRVE